MLDARRKIAVSADDFGLSPEANENILELLSQRKLQRVSVMVDEQLSLEEIRFLLDSQAKLDLHLDLRNLLKNDQDSEEKTGIIGRLAFFFQDYLSGKTSVTAVETDWTRQLEKFQELFGRYPDGLNSHEHIHFFPPYFKLFLALAKKSKIEYLRFGKKDFLKASSPVSLVVFILKKINRRRFSGSRLISSDFLVSLDWLGNDPAEKTKNLPTGEIELIVHPERTAEMEFIKTQKTF